MKIQRKALPVLTPIMAVMFGSFSGLAQAQAPETDYDSVDRVLEEVIVTAQKREQSLQEVPIAVTALKGEFLDKAGITDIFQMETVTPSLEIRQSQSVSSTAFFIRGIGTSANSYGLEPAVAVFVDGVYQARGSSLANEMVDIASVEVLRGPQGTLFGRNTSAGAVTFNSVRPDHEGTGFFELTAGNYDLYAGSGAKSISVVPDVLAIRATGFIKQRGGTVQDLNFGDAYNLDRWGARLQALYTPNEDVSVLFSVDASDLDENCCGQGVILNNFTPLYTEGQGTDVNLANYATVLLGEDFYDRKIVWPAKKLSTSKSDGALMEITWQLDEVQLFSLTAVRNYKTYDGFDGGKPDPVDLEDLEYDVLDAVYDTAEGELSSFSQEFRISGETEKLIYVAGLYYFDQEFDTVQSTFFGAEAAPFHVGLPEMFFPRDSSAFNAAYQDQKAWAVFGQFDYTLTDDLILTAGLRYTQEDKDLFINYENVNPGLGFPYQSATQEREDKSRTVDDSKTTGTLKLSWFANDDIMVYGSLATGYKSSGLNLSRNDPIFPVVVDPEESTTYEVGVKADLVENTLRLNATAYYTDYDNLQTSGLSDIGFIWLNSQMEVKGVEVETNWLATDNLTLNLGYAYTDAAYGDFPNGGCMIFYPWHTGLTDPQSNGDGSCDNSGNRFYTQPTHFFAFNANYGYELTTNVTGYLFGEYSYRLDNKSDRDPILQDIQGDYGLLNLRAGLVFEEHNMELVAWMRNALDEEYIGGMQGTLMQDGKVLAYYRDPRTFGLTLRMFFN